MPTKQIFSLTNEEAGSLFAHLHTEFNSFTVETYGVQGPAIIKNYVVNIVKGVREYRFHILRDERGLLICDHTDTVHFAKNIDALLAKLSKIVREAQRA